MLVLKSRINTMAYLLKNVSTSRKTLYFQKFKSISRRSLIIQRFIIITY
ncbi:hypothetical protein EVA_10589 [gut metagenome]|uniref:Uncharacterized protein n=1 Tax=gut metagenome TaxID=749906 RepID=J9G382_9ZZZZ